MLSLHSNQSPPAQNQIYSSPSVVISPIVASTSTSTAPPPESELELELSGGRVKKFQCTFEGCGKRYTRPTRLEEHIRSHTGERPFVCPHCSSTFGRDSHLKAHVRTHQGEEEKSYGCGMCEKKFWTNQHLKKHVEVIHKGKTYDCTECEETFRKHHLLRSHIAIVHSTPGTNPFICPHPACSKSFKQSVHLKAHQKTHDPSRYLCGHSACLSLALEERQYPTWSALQKHSKEAHAPTCPHPECEGKTFTTRRGLKLHLEGHEKEDMVGGLGEATVGKVKKRRRKKRRRGGRGTDGGTTETGESSFEAEETVEEWERREESEREDRMDDFLGVQAFAEEGERSTKRARVDEELPFACEEEGCSKRYRSSAALESHVSQKHSEEDYSSFPTPTRTPSTRIKTPANVGTTNASTSILDLLTGYNYGPHNLSDPTSSTRGIPCPYPHILTIATPLDRDRDSDSEPEGIEEGVGERGESGLCPYWFKRVYDVERHLRAKHGVEVHREELGEWLERMQESALA